MAAFALDFLQLELVRGGGGCPKLPTYQNNPLLEIQLSCKHQMQFKLKSLQCIQ